MRFLRANQVAIRIKSETDFRSKTLQMMRPAFAMRQH